MTRTNKDGKEVNFQKRPAEDRADRARVHSEMLTLKRNFTETIRNPDGGAGMLVRWINADAERRYKELEKSFTTNK